MAGNITRGVVFIHSAPAALCPHLEWTLANTLDIEVRLEWVPQPAEAGTFRSEYAWLGSVGTGAKLASALRGWKQLRYEITEETVRGSDGARWSHTPTLGIFHAPMDVAGNLLVSEERIHTALAETNNLNDLREALELATGKPWDDELEVFRYAGEGAAIRWLHKVS